MLINKKRMSLIVLVALILAFVLSGALTFFDIKIANNSASAYNSSATITNRVSQIFVEDKGVFDRKELDKLATYAGYTDFNAMVSGATSGDVKSASGFTASGNTTVTMGSFLYTGTNELEWIPVYLSKNTGGDAILTLWLASNATSNGTISSQEVSSWSDGTYKYNFGSGNTQSYNGRQVYAHTYDGSYIRNAILHQGNTNSYTKAWGYYWNGSTAVPVSGTRVTIPVTRTKFTQLTSGDLAQFISAPTTMSWQRSQSGRNDISYSGSDSSYYPTAWQNDKIWLPSEYEIKSGGLWGISSDQLKNNTSTVTRTGTSAYSSEVVYFESSGTQSATAVSMNYGVRPALHLNLSKVNQNAYYFYKNPVDVTDPIYNDNPQTVATLSTTPTWWSNDFTDKDKFNISYYDKTGAMIMSMQNAGDYWVKIEPVSTYKAMFDGAPVTSDSAHLETNSLRWFKFKINRKPLKVKLTQIADGTYTASEFNSSDISQSDIIPTFGVRYTSSDGKGYTVEPPNKPSRVGTYTATVVILNEEAGNFSVDTTQGTHTATYIKKPDRLKKPVVIGSTVPNVYANRDFDYGISAEFDPELMDILYPTTNVTYNEDDKKLSIRNAGTYKIEFRLKSPTETCWDDDSDSVTNVEYTIKIDQSPISVPTFNVAMLNSSEVKNTTNTKVPASAIVDVLSGDTYPNVKIIFKPDNLPNEFNYYPTMPGKYSARLEIEDAENSNYKLNDTTKNMVVNFTVTGEVTFQESDIVWIATPANGGTPIEIKSPYTAPYELPFVLGGYTISVKETTADNQNLNRKGVKVYTDGASDNGYSGDVQQTNVGTYTAKVRIVNYDSSFDAYDETFSLNWKINPHSVPKPVYSGGDITFSKDPTDFATLYGLPADWADYLELEVEKNGSPEAGHVFSDVGTYFLTFKFKSDMSTTGNAIWDDNTPAFPVQATVKINPRSIEIAGWSTTGIPTVTTSNNEDTDYIDYVFTKTDGTVVTYGEVLASTNTTFKVKAVSKYGDNVIVTTVDSSVEDNETFSTPGAPGVPATPVPRPTLTVDSKEYTGAELTFELNGFDGSKMIMDGTLSVTEVGTYTVTIRFRDGVNYCWDDNTRDPFTLTFTVTEASAPPAPPEPSIGEKIKAFFDKLIEEHFPLWQVCTIAVGGLLSIIFLIKSIQYGNRKKKAKGEAKKYTAAKTMAALLPVFDTTVVAGLSNQIWSIIAFSIVGLTAVLFLTAIITRKGWKKAELAKEEAMAASGVNPQTGALMPVNNNDTVALLAEMRREMQETLAKANSGAQSGVQNENSIIEEMRRAMEAQRREDEERRRADEERHRQELEALREEQSKRDEAMKIMLANMMGRQQGADGMDMGYASMDNTDLLVQKVIAGLLPVVQQMVPEPTAYLAAPDGVDNDSINALTSTLQQQNEQIIRLQNQIADMSQNVLDAEVIPDNSEEIQALKEEHSAEIQAISEEMNARLAEMQSKMDMLSSMSVDELDDDDFDDEEEWDSILDEDDDDFVEAIIIDEGGKERKVYPNFRMRLKQSSDKNREWYAVIKNLFCSQKGVTYRVYKRVEKIRYQGQVIAVIGIAKRSIKLWLALKPYEYDARRYHHKDVSDKPRFVDVPMYVRVSSDRALDRSQELILALFQELNMEARKRYTDRPIQELIFTLKHNRLLTNKQNKQLLCEVMHVHDCDVLDDETAEKCIEAKNVEFIDDSNIETVKLDDIDAKFQDGNRVTLDRLKKVGLVSEDCTGFTVTADKRLTKPLIIVANDFSLTAVKLIALTGGRTIKLQTV